MQLMARYPDKYFELAIVDPEYGIGASEMQMGKGKKIWSKGKKWDTKPPSYEYFEEVFRVSKRQIIWGGNYFSLPITGGWLFWDKDRQKEISFADGELAWTNFLTTIKIVKVKYDGFLGADIGGKIHPTQKPVKLYKWLLDKYAKPGDKILDTHLGSGSIAIACHDYGFDLTACELDKDYFDAAIKRIKQHQAQMNLFQAAS